MYCDDRVTGILLVPSRSTVTGSQARLASSTVTSRVSTRVPQQREQTPSSSGASHAARSRTRARAQSGQPLSGVPPGAARVRQVHQAVRHPGIHVSSYVDAA